MTDAAPACTTVYFDGSCPICSREVALYRRLDRRGRIRWHDASRDAGDLAADGVTRADALARLHVRDDDGRLVTGARGFVAIWERLPAFAWLAAIARRPAVLARLERGYAWLAPRRHRLFGWLDRASRGRPASRSSRQA